MLWLTWWVSLQTTMISLMSSVKPMLAHLPHIGPMTSRLNLRKELVLLSVWYTPFLRVSWNPSKSFRWTSCDGFHLPISVFEWSSSPVCMQERWFAPALHWLLWFKKNHEEGPSPTTSHLWPPWQPAQGQNLFENQPLACVPSGLNLRGWRMEDSFPDLLWLLQMVHNALQTHQCTCCCPMLHEWHFWWPAQCLYIGVPRKHTHLLWLHRRTPTPCLRNSLMPLTTPSLCLHW